MDVAIPKMNGLEAAKRIRESVPTSKILFISVDGSRHLAEALAALGVPGFIAETDVRSRLLPAIHKLLGKS